MRGERLSYEPPDHPWYSWRPHPDAHAAVITAADHWCRQLGEQADYDLRKGTLGPVPFDYTDDTAARLREAFHDNCTGDLRGTLGEARREVGVGSYTGEIGLAMSDPTLDAGDWRPALAELTALLRDNACTIAYAYVRRGWLLSVSGSLDRDWPARADRAPRVGGNGRVAFEDVFAPDAYAVQLLGAGYHARVPEAPSYRRSSVGSDALLLEHVDPSAWFDEPFIPFGKAATPEMPPPAVLAAAREELNPILYTPGALSRAGYTDLPEL